MEEQRLLNAIKEAKDKETAVLSILELANVCFRKEEDLKALRYYILAYRTIKLEEVLDFVLSNYYEPNRIELEDTYKKNAQLLKEYQHFYGELPEFNDEPIELIWDDNNLTIYHIKEEFCEFSKQPRYAGKEIDGQIILLSNELNMQNILDYDKETNKNLNILTAKSPMYLYYDQDIFRCALQLNDFVSICESGRVVIIVGIEQLKMFFDDYQAVSPQLMLGHEYQKCVEIVEECVNNKRDQIHNNYIPDIRQYYKYNENNIIENIKSGKPKILFLTCRFTTVLQYHIRDMILAAQEMGIPTMLSIEKSDIHRIDFERIKQISEFKPDIIFIIDYFKFQFNYLPDELFFITWVQDPMPNIMNSNTPHRISKNDFVLNHFTTWGEFTELGYPKDKTLDAPIPANDKIYKNYNLSLEEKERYSADICFVCHAGDFHHAIDDLLNNLAHEGLKNAIKNASNFYYNEAYEKGKFLYSREQFKELIKQFLEYDGLEMDEKGKDILADEFCLRINQKMFRVVLVRWLIDAGYTNIKLWGNGWLKEPEFSKYAMGPAENGEVLSKIYQASKIVIGNNIHTTAAARAWESMLSGAFYMANYIPPEHDITDIRKILQEEKEFVMFYNKEDLLQKVEYYLKHKKERQEMIELGKKKALESMTFSSLMKKTLKVIQERI